MARRAACVGEGKQAVKQEYAAWKAAVAPRVRELSGVIAALAN